MGLIILFLIIDAIVILVGISIYNRLVRARNEYQNAFSQIDVQLQKRHDLIPNLVETAKAYLKHEKETLTAVIDARNQASQSLKDAKSPNSVAGIPQLQAAESTLSSSLSRLMLVVEQYPDLKANQNMSELSESLNHIENRVSFARQAYNDAVMMYHNVKETFPNSIIANWFGFKKTDLFEVDAAEVQKAPKVSF